MSAERLKARGGTEMDKEFYPTPADHPDNRKPAASIRVLFITRKWSPAVGGMESYCLELAQVLAERLPLTVRALPGSRSGMPPSKIRVFGFFLGSLLQIFRHARRYDVVHLGDLTLLPLAWAVKLVSPRTRTFASAHGGDVAYGRRKGLLPAIYRLYQRPWPLLGRFLDGAIANSRATGERCRELGLARVDVIHPGIRLADAEPPPVEPPESYLLFVGRIQSGKGLGWFVDEVLPLLPADLRLRVAGPVWEEREARRALDNARVDYLGPKYGDELARLRRRAVAVVMPNTPDGGRAFEGFGLSALETAADGGILVAACLYGLVDAVADGKTGFLVPSQDTAAWAEKLQWIAGWDLDRRRRFVEEARTVLAKRYSWHRFADELTEVYRGHPAKTGRALQ